MSLRLLLDVDENREPIHLALLELADVQVPVSVAERAVSVFFPVPELAPVLLSVSPPHLALTIDLAVPELALVGLLALLEVVGAHTFEDAVYEVSLVVGSVAPHELAFAVLLA